MDLSINAFELLTPRIFSHPSKVVNLRMRDNRIRKINRLTNMTKLKKVDLTHNCISSLQDGVLNDATKIVDLRMPHNLISTIHGLNDLIELRKLYLHHNRTRNLPPHVFENLHHLASIRVDHNFLTSLDGFPSTLVPLVQVVLPESLILGHNPIRRFDFFLPLSLNTQYCLNLDNTTLRQINISQIKADQPRSSLSLRLQHS